MVLRDFDYKQKIPTLRIGKYYKVLPKIKHAISDKNYWTEIFAT